MTSAVVAAVKVYNNHGIRVSHDREPSLEHPAEGNPISHGQLIDISKALKAGVQDNTGEGENDAAGVPARLSELLRGCNIYVPPPPPKPEKSDEYKALMARLREEDEARKYTQMINPGPSTDALLTVAQRFPNPSHGALFPPPAASYADPTSREDEEMTYADINRQLALIGNVLISIVACSVCVWKAAWHWGVPERLALSMLSSVVVAVAEVAIYAGYLGRLQDAKAKERAKVETKRVEDSWVIQAAKGKEAGGRLAGGTEKEAVRFRAARKAP